MRILIGANHSTLVGGIETYLKEILPALRERGHEVGFLTSAGTDDRGTSIAPPDISTWSLTGVDRNRVWREIAAWAPDVAFQHGMESPDNESAVLDRFPTVLFAHGHAATCVSGSRTHMFPVPQPCAKKFGLGCLVHYFPRRCGGRNPVTMLRLYHRTRQRNAMLARYAAVVVASRYMIEEYRAHGVPDDKLHLAPLFPTGILPDVECVPHSRTDRVLYVGRLYREKGVELLVEAVAEASERLGRSLTLVVAGDGPERSAMEQHAARRSVRSEFRGWVSAAERVELMRGVDVLAVPSVCPETFGLVGVEAGCVGLPAIAYATGGIPDWLVPGVSGESALGERPDPSELAEALCRALANDVHLAHLRLGAWEAARRFTIGNHIQVVDSVLTLAAGSLAS